VKQRCLIVRDSAKRSALPNQGKALPVRDGCGSIDGKILSRDVSIERESMNTEETATMAAVRRPPQGGSALTHEHRFCFAISERKALRGCQLCGKAWIAVHDGVSMGTWQEIREAGA